MSALTARSGKTPPPRLQQQQQQNEQQEPKKNQAVDEQLDQMRDNLARVKAIGDEVNSEVGSHVAHNNIALMMSHVIYRCS